MKKFFMITSALSLCLSGIAQPLQYFMQRSSANVSAMSEVQNLQVFLSGQHSLTGFEGSPKYVLLNVVSPLSISSQMLGSQKKDDAPERSFVGGTLAVETYGVHTDVKAMLGYGYRFFIGPETNITFGLSGGMRQVSSDYGKLDPEADVYSHRSTQLAMQVGARVEHGRLNVSAFGDGENIGGEVVWGRLWDGRSSPQAYNDNDEKAWRGQVAVMATHDKSTQTNVLRISANAVYRGGPGIGVSYQTGKDFAANISLRLTKFVRVGYAYQLLQLNPIAPKHEVAVRYQNLICPSQKK